MIYYTSDWHLGDDRLGIDNKPNVFFRPFSSVEENNTTIMKNLFKEFKDGDTLWHLGDVIVKDIEGSEAHLQQMRSMYPNSQFNLVLGNYDTDKVNILSKYFNSIHEDFNLVSFSNDLLIYLNHYPSKCKEKVDPESSEYSFAITGHIHSLWKVQRKIINVGVDAWHFKPVSHNQILFCWNAMQNHYDGEVFLY
jgi:calcineurin-like phosphoesterase family protein